MPKRDPRSLPEAGDRLEYRGWLVTVLVREGSTVRYTRSLSGAPVDGERRQTLEEWSAWTASAKVKRAVPANGAGGAHKPTPDGECTVFLFGICGPCTACGKLLGKEVHVGDGTGVLHPECCSMKKHGKPRKAKAAA